MTETTRSGFHRFVETRLGPDFLHQNFVSECTDFPPYQLDIYLPEWHACVEVDGPYHLSKKDIERDAYLWEHYRISTYRINAKNGLRHDEVIEQLTAAIEDASLTAASRKAEWNAQRR